MLRHFSIVVASIVVAATAAAAVIPTGDSSAAKYLDSSDGRDWPGYGRTFGEQHFSPLEQINQATIDRLGLAWSMGLGAGNSVTQPIAVDGVLYFATGYSIVHAVDATSGKLLWRHDSNAAERAGLNLRVGWGSRGIAWWNGRIYTGTQDGRLIAIDAKTGTQVWSAQTFDKNVAAYISGAPRTFDGKVIVGYGSTTGKSRGYVTAYDAETGKQLWRFYTVPGDPAEGFENKAMEMASRTWAGEWWKFGGGGDVWNAMAYDAESGTVYLGTGSGYPWNRRARSEDTGDNLFLASILALDGKTGAYKWHYQVSPGDTWDHDAAMDIQLAELTIAGKPRKVLIQAPKNGFFYVIDRKTGKLISAKPYARVTWASRIDLKTGRPVENPDVRYPNGATAEVWPSSAGAHSWMPMAYSPKTGLAYVPAIEAGIRLDDKSIDLKGWQPPKDRRVDGARNGAPVEDPLSGTGALIAWNPATQKAMWSVPYPTLVNGGVMATAGDLVFQGTVDGTFKAFSATTGKLLWSFNAQAPVLGPPISYSANGRQYVTVLTGLGSGLSTTAGILMGGRLEHYGIDPRSQVRRVLTFALDGTAMLPQSGSPNPQVLEDPEFRPDARSANAGRAAYNQHCLICHGYGVVSSTHAPDLRRSAIPLSAEAFVNVVRDGGFAPNGMPAFGEFSEEQLQQLRQYIRTEAEKLRDRSGRRD